MTKLDLALIMNQFGKEGFCSQSATPSRSGRRRQLAGTMKSQTGELEDHLDKYVNNGVNIAVIFTSIWSRNSQWRVCRRAGTSALSNQIFATR